MTSWHDPPPEQEPDPPLSRAEFEAALRRIGDERYHDKHPFNVRMHEGALSQADIQVWVLNRYYYQTRIPIKDGIILTKSGDPAFRRDWVVRLHDHDGLRKGEGGLEQWLQLAEAVGLERTRVESFERVLPGVRHACDDYVHLVEYNDLLASVAASLTELFAGDIMATRIAAFESHYPWVDAQGLAYFESRTQKAPRDSEWGLAYVLEHASTRADQDRCLKALERKCEILWRLLDAVGRGADAPRKVEHAEVKFDEEQGMLVVLPERAVKLGGSGPGILALCDGQRSGEEIADALAERHDDPQIREQVHNFLENMERLGVLEFCTERP